MIFAQQCLLQSRPELPSCCNCSFLHFLAFLLLCLICRIGAFLNTSSGISQTPSTGSIHLHRQIPGFAQTTARPWHRRGGEHSQNIPGKGQCAFPAWLSAGTGQCCCSAPPGKAGAGNLLLPVPVSFSGRCLDAVHGKNSVIFIRGVSRKRTDLLVCACSEVE